MPSRKINAKSFARQIEMLLAHGSVYWLDARRKKERLFIGVFWAGYYTACHVVMLLSRDPHPLLGFSPNSHPFPFYPPNFCLSFTADLMNSCIIIIKDSSPSTIRLSCERVVNTISFAKCGTSTFVMILSFLCIFFANYSSHIHL